MIGMLLVYNYCCENSGNMVVQIQRHFVNVYTCHLMDDLIHAPDTKVYKRS